MGVRGTWFLALIALGATGSACKKSGGASDTSDGSADASGERPPPSCPEVEVGDAAPPAGDAGTSGFDEFGPNAPAAKTASSLGRVNIYEVTSPRLLQRVDVYLRADLDETRVTIAVQEATAKTSAFVKLKDIQLDFATCQGWASSGPLDIPLVAGRFYAIGFDPNQVVMPFVNADADSLPIDGAFGRLIGSKTATSVSVSTLTWDKLTDKEYNRQRIITSPRADDGGTTADAADAGSTADAGASDATGDGARG